MASSAWTADVGEASPLQQLSYDQLRTILPAGTQLMVHPAAIEKFLTELDGQPPDWAGLYGQGHHGPGLDDRLFAFNRARDAGRQGRPALSRHLAFTWIGELSAYDALRSGFPDVVGPRFFKTSWGMVRFKPEEVPGNLCVTTDAFQREQVQRRIEQNQSVEIDVVMTGRPIPDESILYDFSHDEEGVGLIMPFVRVEHVDFVTMKNE
jgi:hypothetical protein